MFNLRAKVLKTAYKLFPFSLKGDVELSNKENSCDISCVINFYGRINLLEGILYSLSEQVFEKERVEVILVEDRGGTKEGLEVTERFTNLLNIKYFAISENFGIMGYSRNFGLEKAKGKYVLFLDDDTVILQKDFLKILIETYQNTKADAIVPLGKSAYCTIKEKYDFHDPFFPTSRCTAYKREVLSELGGFVSSIIGQEDVEFIVRFLAGGKVFYNCQNLTYFHPPLLVNNLSKPASVGLSFFKLKKRYPFIMWLMLLVNGIRDLPLFLFPKNTKWKMQARFSLGFLLGIFYGIIGKEVGYK